MPPVRRRQWGPILLACCLLLAAVSAKALPPYTTGLQLALDAGAGVYNDPAKYTAANANASVALWADQSGNGKDVSQADAVHRPIYQPNAVNGLPSLRFGASAWTNLSNTSLSQSSQAQTLFFVLRPYARNTQTTIAAQNAQNVYHYQGSYSVWDGKNIRQAAQGTVGPSRDWHLLTVVFTPSAITFRINGGAIGFTTTVPAANAANLNSFFVGTNYGNGQAWNGSIAECLLYSAALSGDNLAAVENYLLTKYNLPTPLPASMPLVVHEGDSLSEGVNTLNNTQEYPELTFQGAQGANPYYYRSFAVPGSAVSDLTKRAATVDALYSSSRAKNILYVWVGTNDMAVHGLTPGAAYNALVTYCQARQVVGWKVIVRTMIPRAAYSDDNRLSYNSLIRGGWQTFADGLDDLGADPILGQMGVQSNTAYYSTDKVHLTVAGYGLAATYASAAITKLLDIPPGM